MWSFSRIFLFSILHPPRNDDFTVETSPDSIKILRNNQTLQNHSSSYKVETFAVQGNRPYMEDESFVSQDGKLCAIFDGHGGSNVSKFVRCNIFACFQSALTEHYMKRNGKSQASAIKFTNGKECCNEEQVGTSIPGICLRNNLVPSIDACTDAFRIAFHKLDLEILRVRQWRFQGSTAVAILIHEQGEEPNNAVKRHIISVNIGDSRAVLSRRGIAIDLTIDHKPNDPNENYRVTKLGGQVDWYGMLDGTTGEPLLDTGVFRINGNLAVSRSLGDKSERPFVSSEPDIKVFPILDDYDEFIVLASDGLFDAMSSQEVVSFLHRHAINRASSFVPEHNILAKALAEEAIRRGSSDNVSVIIVWLKHI